MKQCLSVLLFTFVLLHSTYGATYTFAKWYLAGSFNGTTGATAIPSSQNAVGLDISKNQYFPLGSGTNLPAFTTGSDICGNIYYAGQFSTANGVATGPIAVWANNNFTGPYTLTGFAGVIQSMVVDCPVGSCSCDLWIGGGFSFTANDGTAVNIAKYTASSKTWSNLGGVTVHGLTGPTAQTPGVFTVKRANNLVYVGGTFSGLVKSYNIGTGNWSNALLPGATAGSSYGLLGPLPVIHDMRVATVGGNTGVYIGGNFAYGTTCSFTCGYINNGWNKIGGNNQPNGPVFGMAFDNSTLLYIVGNFTAGSGTNIAVTTLSSTVMTGSDFNQAGGSPSFTMPIVFRIEALDPNQYGYATGAYAYSALGAGLAFFYDSDVRTHFPFGTATVQIGSTYYSMLPVPFVTNSAFITGASMPLLIMCIAVLMFFYNQY